ncbi:pyridoxamine kinase [Ignavigranum ruoffiae]|uniref:pyridoxamine kinase n=1 Tax=Ignavigranum ruoffiae TaxID=89093 RepID=UPI0024ADB5FF|nr:pyridoxamine kinase [Ignavigranum ruoffiae]
MNQRILVVNDVPGAGKVAANVNVPVLVASQLETAILPTKILSSQTGSYYSPPIEHDLGPSFADFFSHWQDNQVHFDGILLGYCADPSQLQEVQTFYQRELKQGHPAKLIVDPIMADHGHFYSGFDESYLKAYHDLFPMIDIFTPNLTEACLLTGTPYNNHFSQSELLEIATKLGEGQIKDVIITGVQFEADQIGFYHYSTEKQVGNFISHRYFDFNFFGTGDLTVSLLAASALYNDSIQQSLTWIAQLIEKILSSTLSQDKPPQEGIAFENQIGEIFNHFDQLKRQQETR